MTRQLIPVNIDFSLIFIMSSRIFSEAIVQWYLAFSTKAEGPGFNTEPGLFPKGKIKKN